MNKAEEELYYAMTQSDNSCFSAGLCRLILKADIVNRALLGMIYPDYVDAVEKYQMQLGYWEELCEKMEKKL